MADDNALVNLTALARWGREERNLEYKRSLNWGDAPTKAKLTKSALAMANLRDGGHIVLGIERQLDDSYIVVGMKADDLDSFVQDHLSVHLNEYADPYVDVTLIKHKVDDKDICIIRVHEFSDVPIVCKRDGLENLRRGAMYTRSRKKCETAEVPSQAEMREVLDIAIEKRSRAFSAQTQKMGYARFATPDQFDAQLQTLPIPDLIKKIREKAYWRVLIRPDTFEKAKFQRLTDCKDFMVRNALSGGGWQYPLGHYDRVDEGDDWIAYGADITSVLARIGYWTLFRSGQFVDNFAVPEEFIGTDAWPVQPQVFIPAPGKRYLSVQQTIKIVSCIFEFAARMAYNQVLGPSGVINIDLHGMDGRELSYMSPSRRLDQHYWCHDELIHVERTFSAEELAGSSREFALDVILEILGRFGWSIIPRNELQEDQAQLMAQ